MAESATSSGEVVLSDERYTVMSMKRPYPLSVGTWCVAVETSGI